TRSCAWPALLPSNRLRQPRRVRSRRYDRAMAHHHGDDHFAADRRRLAGALPLVLGLLAAELTVGIVARSLAVLAGAGHRLTDAAALLAEPSRRSLNVRGAFLHVATDLAAFAGTAVAGALILVTGWDRFDPLASLLVATLIFWSSAVLLRDSSRILLEISPAD